MKTPKEEAESLIAKFTAYTISNLGGDQTYENAKQAALLHCELIINSDYCTVEQGVHYELLKTEIEK